MNLDSLKEKVKTFDVDGKGAREYTHDFRKEVLSIHYNDNIAMSSLSAILDINSSLLAKWKAKYGEERTAYRHGTTLRYDVRTKCLAVQRHIEDGHTLSSLAREHGCNQSAVHQWKMKYLHTYKQFLALPDGVPYIVPEHKHVYGNSNIDKVLALLLKQEQELDDQLSVVRSKKESIQAAVTLLQEAGLKVA